MGGITPNTIEDPAFKTHWDLFTGRQRSQFLINRFLMFFSQ